jgi:hypothetical protein
LCCGSTGKIKVKIFPPDIYQDRLSIIGYCSMICCANHYPYLDRNDFNEDGEVCVHVLNGKFKSIRYDSIYTSMNALQELKEV